MDFLVQDARPIAKIRRFPTVVLRRDAWDDYGFKTMFAVTLHLSATQRLDLDSVKVLLRGQEHGYTPMPDGAFSRLGSVYCSLGQASSYYEMLVKAGPSVFRPFLRGLRDVAYLPSVRNAFADEPGMSTSLLRFSGAQRALEEAPALLGLRRRGPASRLGFTYEFPGKASLSFGFGDVEELPNRLAVVIGYNGAGKTRLLANLAMLAYKDEHEAKDLAFVGTHGRYRGEKPSFGAVVAISYSAFDDFAVPGRSARDDDPLDDEHMSEKEAAVRNYTYCGLRKLDPHGNARTELKSIDQLTEEFVRARNRVVANERVDSLRAALHTLAREPSLRLIVDLPNPGAKESAAWRRTFESLSTGHKIVLHILVQLCAHLERRSLVLMDEPEQHLHPSLLAALLQAIGAILERHDSFAIVATHSPVVLQEVPARSVTVLRRTGDEVTVAAPRIETFAENVGLLTTHVFNLDSSLTDYQDVLRRLAESYSLDEIEELFDGRMSAQARSVVLSLQKGWPDADDR